jgi:hypothetical protein
MKIAIIGSAGRGMDGKRLNANSFNEMRTALLKVINDVYGRINWTAVSGGAAWADHLAVDAFGRGHAEKLELKLPVELDETGKFIDNGKSVSHLNPGKTANHYHDLFQQKTGIKSFDQLRIVTKHTRCDVHIGNGFFGRNTDIANAADICIAFTFGDGAKLADGGTADTMRKFIKRNVGRSFHIDLNTMMPYSPALIL